MQIAVEASKAAPKQLRGGKRKQKTSRLERDTSSSHKLSHTGEPTFFTLSINQTCLHWVNQSWKWKAFKSGYTVMKDHSISCF